MATVFMQSVVKRSRMKSLRKAEWEKIFADAVEDVSSFVRHGSFTTLFAPLSLQLLLSDQCVIMLGLLHECFAWMCFEIIFPKMDCASTDNLSAQETPNMVHTTRNTNLRSLRCSLLEARISEGLQIVFGVCVHKCAREAEWAAASTCVVGLLLDMWYLRALLKLPICRKRADLRFQWCFSRCCFECYRKKWRFARKGIFSNALPIPNGIKETFPRGRFRITILHV